MAKFYFRLFYSILILVFFTHDAWAVPTESLVQALGSSVLRVKVNLSNGKHGFGSAVVIAKDEVVTNCHVVNEATDISVIYHDRSYQVTAMKSDWHHDLCILKVEHLDAPIVNLRASSELKYGEAIFTVAYPDETTQPVNTFGVIKELFPMDGSVVIRASSSFKLGSSGGGAFDEIGNLVGIITLKSKGTQAYYYYMPVEWMQALMRKPAVALGSDAQKPFWALEAENQPYFMQVVQPYQTQNWSLLIKVAQRWIGSEPEVAESWFYLAVAEYANHEVDQALTHFSHVLELNQEHQQTLAYLKIIANEANRFDVAWLK